MYKEAKTNPEIQYGIVSWQMEKDGIASENLAGMLAGAEADDADREEAGAEVETQIASMSDAQLKVACNQYAKHYISQTSMKELLTESLSFYDGLWIFFAVGTAFRVGSGTVKS